MAAPIPPEVVEPPVETPPAEPPSPPSPPAPPTLSIEAYNLQRQALSEQAATIQRLQDQLAARNATPVTPPPNAEAFFANPHQAVRDEIAQAVAPLNSFVQTINKDRQYSALLAQLEVGAPQLYALYKQVKPYVDDAMSKVPEVTLPALQFTITSAYGAVQAGLAPPPPTWNAAPAANTPPQPPVTPVATIPPNLPPSPPTPPRRPSAGDELDQKVAALTESERTAARLSGFSDLRQYVQFRDAPPEISGWKDIK